MKFHLNSQYQPSGDQPEAIRQITEALSNNVRDICLLGVTGSGKTFTMANVIANLQRPALILSHNKTLAAQLYGEFKAFFPENAVEYFVSYYDYYQPEAYLPTTDTYIEKDLSINDQIEKLRLSAASALMSGRRDVVVISSVSCLYGIGNPDDWRSQTIHLHRGDTVSMTTFLYQLVECLYSRSETDFQRGTFRVRGDTVDVFLGGADEAVRIAHSTSIPSILVSGLTFFAATFGVGIYSNIDIVSSLCTLMARGALISMAVVITVLPALLMLFDPLIVRTGIGFLPKKHQKENSGLDLQKA